MAFIDVLFAIVGIIGGFGAAWMLFSSRRQATTRSPEADRELIRATTQITSLKDQLETVNGTLEQMRKEAAQARERAVALEAQKESLDVRLKEQREEAEKREKQLKIEFENTGAKILKQMGSDFSIQSEKQIGELLNPVRERLTDFQKLVTESFSAHGKEQHTLKTEIEKIVLQTDSLTKALRGDVKAQGNWGEVMLERILEDSGLRRDVDYSVQMELLDDDGKRKRPDVVVKLPDNKHIILDSKVSLTSYDRLCAATDEVSQSLHLNEFLNSVRTHVAGLEQKRYQDLNGLGTPDYVVMFMPIEGAYSLAVQRDPELHSYAWDKNIVLANPANLFAILRTVANLWRIEQQNRNTQKIAEQGGKLYDKLYGFCQDMLSLGRQLTTAQKTYDNALNKLSEGRGNVLSQAEKLKALGAKTSQSLPAELLGGDEEDDEAEAPRIAAAAN